ncbi:MAG: T9SS type A sorting domain-containing protein [Saprospiraceae bacterium]|nr:T9SS type A sorting domain-containing protein [Saprospiraceae bacterium]
MKRFFLYNQQLITSKWLIIIALLCSFKSQMTAQNCNPDTLPPVAVCNEIVYVSLAPDDPNDCYGPAGPNNQPPALGPLQGGSIAFVPAATFNAGSYDECGNALKFTVQRIAPYSSVVQGLNTTNGQVPCDDLSPDLPSEFERAVSESESIKFYAAEFNTTQNVLMRVYQLNPDGSIAYHNGQPLVTSCTVEVVVEDKIDPVCIAPPNVTVTCDAFDQTYASYGVPTLTDNACLDSVATSINASGYNPNCQQGTIFRIFKAFDCSGNSSICSQRIQVNYNQNYYVRFPNDVIASSVPPDLDFGAPTYFGEDCELMGTGYSDQIFNNDPNANYRIERTWQIINWCTYNPNLGVTVVPNPNPNATSTHPANLPGPIVSAAGTQTPWAPTISNLFPNDPAPTDFSTFWSADANMYEYRQIIWIIDTFFVGIEGTVFQDTSNSCDYQTGEHVLEGWTVKVTGLTTGEEVTVQTDSQGYYSVVMNGQDSVSTVTLINAGNFGQGCSTFYTVHGIVGQTVTQDIPVHLEERCELMSIGIATPFLRRCFTNRYNVQACNLNSEVVENAYVEVDLDNYLAYTGSQIPGTPQGNNRYRFDLGDLQPGDCQMFWIDAYISCDAELGITHCTEARIYPFDDCRDNLAWTGADVKVTAECDGDSVRLKLANIGDGNMAQLLDFVVVEDIIMRQSSTFQLNQLGELTLSFPANGSTWRIEAEEEPFHPFGGIQAAALEGCGGINQLGLINLFPLSDNSPFVALDCRQNIGSFDPNDKQGFPTGLGSEHQVLPNTDIEYLIRFQNTGTDTAFNIVVIDTLSALLDPASIRIGASSHTMEFGITETNILRFNFPNIMLPDSNINEVASHGYVKFRVSQKPDLADGAVINNDAAIYFDFNDPIITNTTFHTIREHLTLVSIDDPAQLMKVKVIPNPARTTAEFVFDVPLKNARFELQNQMGQLVRFEKFDGFTFRFDRGLLTSGLYLFKITDQNGQLYTGKIVIE